MSSETRQMERSDLVEWATHEHVHLSRLFDDLRATFNAMAQGEWEEEEREEALSQALEDLDGALEDMLEHFNEEEEVYFLAIEQRFPEYGESIEALVKAHEAICDRVQQLQQQLAREEWGGSSDRELSARLIALVNSLALEVERHNEREQEVFSRALQRLSPDERVALMDHKHAL